MGRPALRAAQPRIRELRGYSMPTPDLARNLRITLEDFDDPGRAVERDPRSPGGAGYSGTQAILRYVFGQSLTINAFDELGYMVRSASHLSKCAGYADAAVAQSPDREDCRSWLGPNQPGVTTPDPSGAATATARARERSAHRRAPLRPAPGRPRPGVARAGAGRPRRMRRRAACPACPARWTICSSGSGSTSRSSAWTPRSSRAAGASPDPTPLLDFLLAP